jgi:hypothetical protein
MLTDNQSYILMYTRVEYTCTTSVHMFRTKKKYPLSGVISHGLLRRLNIFPPIIYAQAFYCLLLLMLHISSVLIPCFIFLIPYTIRANSPFSVPYSPHHPSLSGGQYTNLLFQSQQLGLTGRWPAIKKSYALANKLMGDIIKVHTD